MQKINSADSRAQTAQKDFENMAQTAQKDFENMAQKTKNADKQDILFEEKIVSEITEDFRRRQMERRALEAEWQVCLDFLNGKQYSVVTSMGEVVEDDGDYSWQHRNVFNHITPVVDTRLSKLCRIRPVMSVRPATEEKSDVHTAKLSAKVLNATCSRINFDEIITRATRWSEVTGTAFYHVTWNAKKGSVIGYFDGESVAEGDVEAEVISPFEIFPDYLSRERVEDCNSIIRARVVSVNEIERVYGVKVNEEQTAFTLGKNGKEQIKGGVTLIERYEKPTDGLPDGRIVTVAGGKLLSITSLPFINGENGNRTYPFIRQVSQISPGCFFGTGVIARLIPVQRAYNAVKNRKHEFLNRISMGVLTVEDGSVDVDDLMEDGLRPGKIIVYRQGSERPKMMEAESIPTNFETEEEKLLEEFVLLGGVNEVSSKFKQTLGVTSAAGLQILLEQDDERLTVQTENIRRAVRESAKHVIRLFKQFATAPRLMRTAGEDGRIEAVYFSAKDVTCDDVVFQTESELSNSPSQKRSSIMEIVSSGLLSDENGNIAKEVKEKILEIIGLGGLLDKGKDESQENVKDVTEN